MKLKNIEALVAAILCFALFSSSCKKNLEEKPYSSLSSSEVFDSETGLREATLGIYQNFTNAYFTTWYRFCLDESGQQYSTEAFFGDAFCSEENAFLATPESQVAGEADAIWAQDYSVIARANTVIGNATTAVSDTSIANKYIAEARFLRGFAYFDLVRMFGGVPIIDQQITSLSQTNLIYGKRASVQDTYNFIVADMAYAAGELPNTRSGSDVGRVTAGTAIAMLGKVYLTMAGKPLGLTTYYQKAVDELKKVVGTANEAKYNFALLPKISDVYAIANKKNAETLLAFSFYYSSSNTSACLNPFFSLPRGYTSGDEQTFFALTYKFFQLYENNDQRRDLTMISRYKTVYNGDGGALGDSIIYNPARLRYIDTNNHAIFGSTAINSGIAFGKYDRSARPAGSPPWGYSTDLIMYRFSDVLLCLAEAEIEAGDPSDALVLINRVRARAGASQYTDQTNMEAKVRLERKLELMGDYTTVFDIRRWGTLQSEISAMVPSQLSGGVVGTYNTKYELYPIPQAEINTNPNLTQNPGY
jgi:hypothetical protein